LTYPSVWYRYSAEPNNVSLYGTSVFPDKPERRCVVFEALSIFVAGISGVFLGMALLYISIKIVSGVISRVSSDSEEGEK
jgi:hypothetical protein